MRKDCPECRGQRRLYYMQWPTTEASFDPRKVIGPTAEITVTKTLEDCRTCGGAGDVAVTERIPVFQHGRKIGTVPPDFDPMRVKSTSWLYDVRPGDFRENGLTWEASRTLGPGDLEAVPGFRWERD